MPCWCERGDQSAWTSVSDDVMKGWWGQNLTNSMLWGCPVSALQIGDCVMVCGMFSFTLRFPTKHHLNTTLYCVLLQILCIPLWPECNHCLLVLSFHSMLWNMRKYLIFGSFLHVYDFFYECHNEALTFHWLKVNYKKVFGMDVLTEYYFVVYELIFLL